MQTSGSGLVKQLSCHGKLGNRACFCVNCSSMVLFGTWNPMLPSTMFAAIEIHVPPYLILFAAFASQRL